MMALLKCCEEKHWFATPLIHCWCERNLHSRQTQGRSGLSLAGWLDTSSLSSGLRFGFSHSALAHNLQAGFAEDKKNSKSLGTNEDALPHGNAVWLKTLAAKPG